MRKIRQVENLHKHTQSKRPSSVKLISRERKKI